MVIEPSGSRNIHHHPYIDPAAVGAIRSSGPLVVTAERIAAYADSINDRRGVERADDVAPTMFAIVPAFVLLARGAMSVVGDRTRADFLHAEHRVISHHRIRPGDILSSECQVIGIRNTSAGALVTTRALTKNEHGTVVTTQFSSTFVRSHKARNDIGERFPDSTVTAADSTDTRIHRQAVDVDQPVRYSQASGDTARIHLDEAVARKAGLPGVIVHGLCTMGMAAVAAAEALTDGHTDQLAEISCRFAAPVLPADVLTTKVHVSRSGSAEFTAQSGNATVLERGAAKARTA